MENTKGFWNNAFGLTGSMGAIIQDPYVLATLPIGGSVKLAGEGAKAIATTAAKAGWQEMKIATVAEVPIQANVYDYKNELDIDYSISDAFFNGALGVATGSIFRAGGSAFIDISSTQLAKTMGILIDKLRLIEGKSTENIQIATYHELPDELKNVIKLGIQEYKSMKLH